MFSPRVNRDSVCSKSAISLHRCCYLYMQWNIALSLCHKSHCPNGFPYAFNVWLVLMMYNPMNSANATLLCLLGTDRLAAAGSSLPDTLSLLHYCGSCNEQCNNERASVSWAQPWARNLRPARHGRLRCDDSPSFPRLGLPVGGGANGKPVGWSEKPRSCTLLFLSLSAWLGLALVNALNNVTHVHIHPHHWWLIAQTIVQLL